MGQGTWMIEADERVEVISALQMGVELGMNHIDTAEMYGDGEAEKIVGEAIKDIRKKAFLVSKVLPSNASYKGTLKACEHSLKRLKTDYLDCYLIHWREEEPLEETFKALDELERDGKIIGYGVSNFSVDDLEESIKIVGKNKIVCNQVYYQVGERDVEHHVIPWCEKNNMAVVAYSPLGQGAFPSESSPKGKVLNDIAEKRDATPRQVMLAFLLRHKNTFVVPKASKKEHVQENVGAADVKLSKNDLTLMNKVFPLRKPKRELPTV